MGREYEGKDFENMGGYNDSSFGAKIADMLQDAGKSHLMKGIAGIGGPRGQVPRASVPGTTDLYVGDWTAIGASALRRGTIDLVGANQGIPGRGNVELGSETQPGRSSQATRAQLRSVRETFVGRGHRSAQATRAQLRTVRETFVGQVGRSHKLEKRIMAFASGRKKHRRLNWREVPGRLVERYLESWKDAYRTRFAKAPAASEVADEKNRILSAIANAGGRVVGQVAVVGDWVADAGKITGKVIGKTGELALRMTGKAAKALVWDIPKAAFKVSKGVFYDPVKKTFFKKGKAKSGKTVAVQVPQPIPSDYYSNPNVMRRSLTPADTVTMPSTEALAARIARRKNMTSTQQAELAARIETARNRARLADLEKSEMEKVKQLEDEAATAEAEAAQAEADVTEEERGVISGFQPSKRDSLVGAAQEARVAAQVLKAAGPFAKMAILASPFRAAVIAAGKIFVDAKKDPRGAQKVAMLKEASKTGDPGAEKILDTLKLGKKTVEELEAAKIAEKELLKKVAEKEGATPTVVGMLPSSEAVIVAIPGAKLVYQKAKAGDRKMLALAQESAKILRGVEAGDTTSKATLAYIQRKAQSGDKGGQLGMAAMAVAAAGIREERAGAASRAKAPVTKEATRIKQEIVAKLRPIEKGVTGFLSTLTAADKHAQGTQIKIAQAQARRSGTQGWAA